MSVSLAVFIVTMQFTSNLLYFTIVGHCSDKLSVSSALKQVDFSGLTIIASQWVRTSKSVSCMHSLYNPSNADPLVGRRRSVLVS